VSGSALALLGAQLGVQALGHRTAPDMDVAAIYYAATGQPVFPLYGIADGRCTCRTDCGRDAGKHPHRAQARNGHLTATADLGSVGAWNWSQANVGARPLPGVVVLDIDPRNSGDTELLALTRRCGPLTPTRTAHTGGGGLHCWYRHDGPARAKLCPGVDVKTHHGYVVAPPSMHVSGTRYRWSNGREIAPAPAWITRLLTPPAPVAFTPRAVNGSASDAALVATVATQPEGNRNNYLYWAACRVYERGGDPAVLEALIAAAVAGGQLESKARATVASAGRNVGAS
jgi:hypothetical protein